MPFWALSSLTGLLLLMTLVPLSRREVWWIRAFDFPRAQLAVLAVGLLAILVWNYEGGAGAWTLFAITSACLVYQLWWIVPYTRFVRNEVKPAGPVDPKNTIRILAANVLGTNRKAHLLLALVEEYWPDVLVVVETNRWWEDALRVLEKEYPHVVRCPLENLYGMHVYSRLPLEDAVVQFLVERDVPSVHAAVVLRSGQRVRLHCLHPTPPSPTENPESTERDAELIVVAKSVAEARLPAIVTGDLNDVAWSATTRLFRKISGLLDPRVGRGMFNTFHASYPFFRWPLDHVFHSEHFTLVRLERLRHFGSDHFPILIELAFTVEQAAQQEGLHADKEDRAWAEEKTAAEAVSKEDVHAPKE